MDGGITLVVVWKEQNDKKEIKFQRNLTIPKAAELVFKEFGRDPVTADQYGLLMQSMHGGFDIWLDEKESIGTTGLVDGQTISFELRLRPLKVRIIDGNDKSVRTVKIDESLPVGIIVKNVCNKIGIQNHEEYSLVVDDTDGQMTIQTLRRLKKDTLNPRKPLLSQQDEELWLQHELTLRAQGVPPEQPLVLRKKFFFSDQEINKDDPVQINLLYGQAKNSIIKGEHPCTLDEAVQFAGMQVHIEHGNHNPERHKPGCLEELHHYLPAEFVKTKGVEKMIFAEHKKLMGKPEIKTKFKYINMCRALKTYGITFFPVREKVKGRNKLIPRLLGVTRESVMRLDDKTKEVLRTWPLTTVKRWVASANSFTLDFGSYSDYYSVQTREGDKISELIAGYIDIILKKRRRKENLEASINVMSAQEGNTESEAAVAQLMTVQSGQAIPPRPRLRSSAQAQSVMTKHASRANNSFQVVMQKIQTPATLPHLGESKAAKRWRKEKEDARQHNLKESVAAVLASCCGIVTLTTARSDNTRVNFTAVGAGVSAISSNMRAIADDVAMLMALCKPQADALKFSTSQLAEALRSFVDCVAPTERGIMNRPNILQTAGEVGEAAESLLRTTFADDIAESKQDELMNTMRAIVSGTNLLIEQAKDISIHCPDNVKASLLGAAKNTAVATTQLGACAKILLPCIQSSVCQNQLQESARALAASIETLVSISQSACQDDAMTTKIAGAATSVSEALAMLIQGISDIVVVVGCQGGSSRSHGRLQTFSGTVQRTTGDHSVEGSSEAQSTEISILHERACEEILRSADSFPLKLGDSKEMLATAKQLAKATTVMINELKKRANNETDPARQKEYLKTARCLADATAELVTATKAAAQTPNSNKAQQSLLNAVNNLRDVTKTSASDVVLKRAVTSLITGSKESAAAIVQLVSAARTAEDLMCEKTARDRFFAQCDQMNGPTERLVAAINAARNNPMDAAAQMDLVFKSQDFIAPANRLAETVQAVAPTLSDAAGSLQLTTCARSITMSLSNLQSALNLVGEASTNLELNHAVESVLSLVTSLDQLYEMAEEESLHSMPGDDPSNAVRRVLGCIQSVKTRMKQFQAAVTQGNEELVNFYANAITKSLKELTVAVQVFGASTPRSDEQRMILSNARKIMQEAAKLLMAGKKCLTENCTEESSHELKYTSKLLLQSLSQLGNCLPGQKAAQQCAAQVRENAEKLNSNDKFTAVANGQAVFHQRSAEVMASAAQVTKLVQEVRDKALHGQANEVQTTSKQLVQAHEAFIEVGCLLANGCETEDEANELISFLKLISGNAEKIVNLGAQAALDPMESTQRNLLSSAVRGIESTMNELLTMCSTAAPTQKHCDTSIRTLEAAATSLQEPTAAVNNKTYFACLDDVVDQSKSLGTALSSLASHCHKRDPEQFNSALREATNALVGLCENASQTAYLVAASDLSIGSERASVLNQAAVIRAKESIDYLCAQLSSPALTTEQGVECTKQISSAATGLFHMCKVASSKTKNPVLAQQLNESASAISVASRQAIAEVKQFLADMSSENRTKCIQHTTHLRQTVEQFLQLATENSFNHENFTVSSDVRKQQEPICEAGRSIAQIGCSLINTAKNLISSDPKVDDWEAYAKSSNDLSKFVETLVISIEDAAPGQKECDQATFHINHLLHDLQETQYSCQTGELEVADEETMITFQEEIFGLSANLREACDALRNGAVNDPAQLALAAEGVRHIADSLLTSMIGAISHVRDSDMQESICEQGRTLLEGVGQLILVARECGGNSADKQRHRLVVRARENLEQGISEFCEAISQHSDLTGAAIGNLNNISRALDKLDLGEPAEFATTHEFVDYQVIATKHVRKLAAKAQDMTSKALTDPEALPNMTNDLTNQLLALISDTTGVVKGFGSDKFGTQLKSAVRELGLACGHLVEHAGMLHRRPEDVNSKQEFTQQARSVVRQVNTVMQQLQQGSRGTQACINASNAVEDTLTDLETTLMFASAGSLASEEDASFSQQQPVICDSAQSLIERTKTLLAASTKSQISLADATESLCGDFDALIASLKSGACSLGSEKSDVQVLLLNAARDVSTALADVLNITKAVASSPHDESLVQEANERADCMSNHVATLLKTVRGIDDETQRVTQALEAAVQAIEREETVSSIAEDNFCGDDSVANLMAASKPVTSAITKLVTAMSSGHADKITNAAHDARKAAIDLLQAAEIASVMSDTSDGRREAVAASKGCAAAVRGLLLTAVNLRGQPGSPELKKEALEWSRKVASNLGDVSKAAQQLKGENWVDPSDPNVMAEQELLTAASAIDAAADKLASLQPRTEVVTEDLPFEEQIVGAAKNIASATSSLVKAANAAQKEMAGSAAESPDYYSEEAQWSSSMISAAKLVAFATQNLCESANATAQGGGADEHLVASAKSVANSTAQLMLACRAKMDSNSPTAKRLLGAGAAVKKAADRLVESARHSTEGAQAADLTLDERPVQQMRQEIEAVEAVLRQERELENAKRMLAKLRATKYKKNKPTWASSLEVPDA